ncbi:hypothetical protein LSH36_46g07084 [Paralvinella palmiformis]|uniref:Uncharacterized protein n=1 Tax=Paralvinella palmiformis TaxID=53620 RepID=A0AAD9K6P2_9ANNE|nr:hypothetical protein LSH36_46g07084 [Paralvinella palmiformis]
MADKDSLTFRIMLTKLSHVLGSRELETMKYICLNRIPRAILEEIQTPIQLWIALEERDVISPDDVSFLNTIITDACAGRQDVIQILNEYKDQSYGLKNKEELGTEFDIITTHLGNKWRKLARKLGLSEMDIISIVHQNPNDLQEQIRQSLLKWQQRNKHSVGKSELIKALDSAEFRMLAHQIRTVSP